MSLRSTGTSTSGWPANLPWHDLPFRAQYNKGAVFGPPQAEPGHPLVDGSRVTKSSNQSERENSRTTEFLHLLGRHEHALQAFVAALVPHWADADEIVQQTRILLWEEFDRYDPAKDFGAWARTIAHYQVLTFRKKSSRRSVLNDAEFLNTVAEEFDRTAEHFQARYMAAEACLRKLAEAKRRLVLRYYSGRETMQQIATATGQTLDSVKHTISRARLALAKCIEESLRQEADR